MNPEKFDAVISLVGNDASFGITKTGVLEWYDKNIEKPTDDAVQTKLTELQADYDAKKYQRDRNYPDIGEQLDMLWHAIDNGEILGDKSCNFFKTLKKVKDDNPKPE